MHVCLFDIDGTLISSGGAGKSALEAALEEEFQTTPQTDSLVFSGRTDPAIVGDLFRLHAIEDTVEHRRRLLDAYLRHLPTHLQLRRGQVLPGVQSLLDRLQTLDRTAVGLLTGNIRAGAEVKLGHFGLSERFAFGGFGDRHVDRDDVAREALAEVQSRFGTQLSMDQVWVLGDTPLDVRCARAIGARVAAVATGWHSLEELAAEKPDLLFKDLTDPTELLAHWTC